ncbi:MAG: tetratricopeptide repeat protein, partial [Candidatus Methylomirabilales bacterium]
AAIGVAALYRFFSEYQKGLDWSDKIQAEYLRERNRIIFLRRLGRVPEALAAGKRAVELNPNDARAYSNLAGAYSEKDDLGKAIELCQKAIEIDPADLRPQSHLGFYLFRRGKLEPAIEHLRESIRLGLSNSIQTRWSLASALFLSGEDEEALREWRTCLSLYSKIVPEKAFQGIFPHRQLGWFLRHKGKPGEALEVYSGGLDIGPENEYLHGDIAQTLEEGLSLELAPALDALLLALEKHLQGEQGPRPVVLRTLGQALIHHPTRKDPARALDCARRAVELTGGKRRTFLGALARVQAAAGDLPAAVATLERALGVGQPLFALEAALAEYRRSLLPQFASFRSVEAFLDRGIEQVLVPENAEYRHFPGTEEPSPDLEWTGLEFSDEGWRL